MADEAQVLADAKKLPLDEQLAHSSWKVRAQALETVKERVGRAFSTEDEIFAEAGGRWPIAVVEELSHEQVQLRARTSMRHIASIALLLGVLPRFLQARCWPKRRATPMQT